MQASAPLEHAATVGLGSTVVTRRVVRDDVVPRHVQLRRRGHRDAHRLARFDWADRDYSLTSDHLAVSDGPVSLGLPWVGKRALRKANVRYSIRHGPHPLLACSKVGVLGSTHVEACV